MTITLDGTSTGCTLSGGVVSFTAVGTCKIDANQAGNANWNAAPQVQQSITVNKGNQTISFTSTNPSPVTVGGATYTPTATATSGLAVTITLDGTSTGCTLSGGVVSFTAVGTCKIDANQAGNANWNAAPQVQQSITVNKGNQTISFTSTNPSPVTVGGATYTPTATATSGLAVTITLDGTSTGCTLSGGVVSFTAVGTCKIDANQAGNANWNAAPQVQQSITVNKGNQTISFTSTNPSPVTVGGATYTPTATATSGLAVTITVDASSSAVCSISGGVVSFEAAGTCTLDANQAGNVNWNAAPQVQQSITVNKGNQTISFTSTAPGTASVGGATYTPTATATSGLAVTITVDASSSAVCSISGGVVSFEAAGTCTLDANQAGNVNWNAAPQVQQSITVNKGNQTISFTSTAPGTASVGGATYTPTATATSGLTVTITVDASSSAVCSISGGVVSFEAAGTCTLDANQAGNANWNAAPQVQQGFTVKRSQTITFTTAAPGGATVGGATYTPTATATSGLTVTITVDASSSAVCSISGGVVSYQAGGSCVLDANQAGNATYYAAPQVQQSFAVTGLTITGDQFSSGTSSNPRMTLSGTGATNASAVTVKVCTVNSFPCSAGNTASTVATGATPSNPWTTAATGATALSYDTVYYAQATQGTQTSPVFTFTTPLQTAPTAVVLANGGTAGTIDSNDTATVTFSAQLNASSICSAWTNTGTQTVTNATITFTNSANNDTFAATSATCTGTGNFGTVSTGGNYISGTVVTFTGSTITWNPTTDTLTFKLGTLGTGSANRHTGVTAGAPGYTASANVTDLSGVPVSTSTFTSGSTSGF